MVEQVLPGMGDEGSNGQINAYSFAMDFKNFQEH
jgi:hypothetical protein